MVKANGKQPVFLRGPIQAGERMWVDVSWQDKILNGDIVSSVWNVPTGFTVHESLSNVTIVDNGKTYLKCCRALISTTLTEGVHFIPNTITSTVSDGQELIDGVYITVKTFNT